MLKIPINCLIGINHPNWKHILTHEKLNDFFLRKKFHRFEQETYWRNGYEISLNRLKQNINIMKIKMMTMKQMNLEFELNKAHSYQMICMMDLLYNAIKIILIKRIQIFIKQYTCKYYNITMFSLLINSVENQNDDALETGKQ